MLDQPEFHGANAWTGATNRVARSRCRTIALLLGSAALILPFAPAFAQSLESVSHTSKTESRQSQRRANPREELGRIMAQRAKEANGPQCTSFSEEVENWGACNPPQNNIGVQIMTEGTNKFLRVSDEMHGSMLCSGSNRMGGGPSPYTGDWTAVSACTNFCLDIRVHEAGQAANDEIQPRIGIQSGGTTAWFRASKMVAEGAGWSRVCIPVGTISPGQTLPANSDGQWEIQQSTAFNPAWNQLITNVENVMLPVDFSSSPSEVIDYDNICLSDCGGESGEGDVTVKKTLLNPEEPYAPGDEVTFKIEVSVLPGGTTTWAAGDVKLEDLIPSGLSLVSIEGSGWACQGTGCKSTGAITIDQQTTLAPIYVKLIADDTGEFRNCARVGGNPDSNGENNQSCAVVTVAPPPLAPPPCCTPMSQYSSLDRDKFFLEFDNDGMSSTPYYAQFDLAPAIVAQMQGYASYIGDVQVVFQAYDHGASSNWSGSGSVMGSPTTVTFAQNQSQPSPGTFQINGLQWNRDYSVRATAYVVAADGRRVEVANCDLPTFYFNRDSVPQLRSAGTQQAVAVSYTRSPDGRRVEIAPRSQRFSTSGRSRNRR